MSNGIIRTTWYSENVDKPNAEKYAGWGNEERKPCSPEKANLISSLTLNGKHAPVIDLDFPCMLVPSSTDGHFHLYLDKELTWKQYYQVLHNLASVGIIEQGFWSATSSHKASYVRPPWVTKKG